MPASGLKGGCGNCRRGVKSAQPADKWIHLEHEMSEHGVMEALQGTTRRAGRVHQLLWVPTIVQNKRLTNFLTYFAFSIV